MKPRPWYRLWPEAAALVFGIGWISLLPRRAVLGLSRVCGTLAHRFSKRLRDTGRENLDLVFGGEMTPGEKDALLRRCFQHFALLVLDIIWFSFRSRPRMAKWITWDPASTAPIFRDEAQILLTAHYGNWETVGQAYAARGQPVQSVATPLKNPVVDRMFVRIREKTGQKIIPRQGAARKLLLGLRNRAKIAVLLDQNTRPRDGGIFVSFFGRQVPVSSAPAALAIKTGVPVYPVVCVPDENGVYTVTVHGELRGDPKADNPVAELTGRMTRCMESIIREQPAFWCWMYQRWRIVPESENLAEYPAYARHVLPHDLSRNKPQTS